MTRMATLLFCLIVTATAHADPLDDLRTAIADRLLLMEDVARYKWNHRAPIADPEREAALLAAKVAHASALGVPETYARRVLEAQLAASRRVQADFSARWTAEGRGEFTGVPDLAGAQRPKIDAATDRLIESVRRAICELARADAHARLTAVPDTLRQSAPAWSTATEALWPPPDGIDCPSAAGG